MLSVHKLLAQYSQGLTRSRALLPKRPLFPEHQESPIYRPLYEQRTKQLKNSKELYKKKLNLIVSRAKKAIEERGKPVKKQLEREGIQQFMFDEETRVPIGIGYDDFINLVKQRNSASIQAQYHENLSQIIEKLNLADTVDLASLNSYLLSDAFKGDYLQKARAKVAENLVEHIKRAKDSQHVDQLIDDSLTGHQKEFVLQAVQEGSHQKLTTFLKPNIAEDAARDMALKDFDQNIAKYRQIQNTLKQNKEINSRSDVYQQDPYYHSPLTNSDESDIERLLGKRKNRYEDGDEILQTADSIKQGELQSLVKRNYFRNKRAHFLSKQWKPRPISVKQLFPSGLDQRIQSEAFSLGQDGKSNLTYEEIYERIDYFIKGAPGYIQQMGSNPRSCADKAFYPQILSFDLQQRQLQWDAFSKNYEQLFPLHNRKRGVDPSELSAQEQSISLKEEQFALELYKEFRKPNNEQFFKHYLANDLRIVNAQHEFNIQRSKEGKLGLTEQLTEDLRKLQEFPDEDLPESDEELSGDDELRQVDTVKSNDIFQQYIDAKEEAYYGKGKRKSCRTAVKISKGHGIVTINNKPIHYYYVVPYYRALTLLPLNYTGLACYLNAQFTVRGSGNSSQAQAMCNALSRALVSMCPGLKSNFRKLNFTRTDRRKVECKKPGLLKARKSPPYNRR